MNKTSPIKTMDDLHNFTSYYRTVKPNPRDNLLLVMGLNTALRISDILALTWEQVYDFKGRRVRTHLLVKERKTGKTNCIFINDALRDAIMQYQTTLRRVEPEGRVFTSQMRKTLSRAQAYRIVSDAAKFCGIDGVIGCHSMRKTFAYHAWKQGAAPTLIMSILNHSSFDVTKRYLGIEQDEMDEIYENIYKEE